MSERRQCPDGVILVVRAASEDEALTICRGVAAAGLTTIEVTRTVPGATKVLRALAVDRTLTLGAGTVREPDDVDRMVDAGATFIVSPVANPAVIDRADRLDVTMVAGGLTPTEVEAAWKLGVAAVKIFPVGSVGGVSYVRAIREPLPDVELIVSGGIDPLDVGSYRSVGCRSVCLGGSLVDREAARRLDIEGVRRHAATVVQSIGSWQ